MPSVTPREDVRAAFKTVLDTGELLIPVYDHMPYEGAKQRSVVLTLISGSSLKAALGNRISTTTRGLEEHFRLQVDCYSSNQTEAGKLAAKVEKTILANADLFRAIHDIHHIRKVNDVDDLPSDPTVRECRVSMDFIFYTHRLVI